MFSFAVKTVVAFSLIGQGHAAPMASCLEQAGCLVVTRGACDAYKHIEVCLSWMSVPGCVKSPFDTVSHSCPVEGGLGSALNIKTDPWSADTPICVAVMGGVNAVFGVKDGSTCSDPDIYQISSGDFAECTGPENVCEGGNVKECAWHFGTDECPTMPPGWYD